MIKFFSPDTESELVILKSLFDAEDIHYFVLNDHFGTLRVGPKIDLFNAKTILISEDDIERAKEIFNDFYKNIQDDNEVFKSSFSVPDKIRMVIETLLLGWFIPGNRWNRQNKND